MRINLNLVLFQIFLIYLGNNQRMSAFQGIWLLAFGAGQAGVGGAFYDPKGSPLDLEENPAMLSRIGGTVWQFSLATNRANIQYKDQYMDPYSSTFYANDKRFSPIAPLPALGFATNSGNWAWGISSYVQGGGGANLQGLYRAFPKPEPELNENTSNEYNQLQLSNLSKENITAKFLFLKTTAGLTYKWGNWSLGFGLDVAYSKMEMRRENISLIGDITLPGGFAYNSDKSFSLVGKIGFYYKFGESTTIAISYSAKNRMYMDGKIRPDSWVWYLNQEFKVSRYMQWPERAVLGIEHWVGTYRFVFDLSHTVWSKAFTNSDFYINYPVLLTPIQTRSSIARMQFNWKNQIALTLGFEKYFSKWITRFGYSYAPTPQTPKSLNPIMGTNMDHHFFSGLGYIQEDQGKTVQWDIAFQYSPPKTIQGEKFSDWWLSHAVETNPNRINLLQYEKTTSVFSIYLGAIIRIKN